MSPPTSSKPWTGQPAYWKGLACHQTPDDLWNFAELVTQVKPALIVEVGPGEGGTAMFLNDLNVCPVVSIDKGDPPPFMGPFTFVILDGDVYSQAAMLADLEIYAPKAEWLVLCHTIRQDWGSHQALTAWYPSHIDEWNHLTVRHTTRHTWMKNCA